MVAKPNAALVDAYDTKHRAWVGQDGMYTAPRWQGGDNVVTNDLYWRERMRRMDKADEKSSRLSSQPENRAAPAAGGDQELSMAQRLREKLQRAMATPADSQSEQSQASSHDFLGPKASQLEPGFVPRYEASRLQLDKTPRLHQEGKALTGADGEERRSSKKINHVDGRSRSGFVGGGLVADDGFGYGRLVDPRDDLVVARASMHVHRDQKHFPSPGAPYRQELVHWDDGSRVSHPSREQGSAREGAGEKWGGGGGIARNAAVQMLGGMSALRLGHGNNRQDEEGKMDHAEGKRGDVSGQVTGRGKWSDIEEKQHALELLRKEQLQVARDLAELEAKQQEQYSRQRAEARQANRVPSRHAMVGARSSREGGRENLGEGTSRPGSMKGDENGKAAGGEAGERRVAGRRGAGEASARHGVRVLSEAPFSLAHVEAQPSARQTAVLAAQKRFHAAPSEEGLKQGGRVTLSEQPFSFGEEDGGRGGDEGGGRGGRLSAGNRRREGGGGGGVGRAGNNVGEGSPHAKLADLDPPERGHEGMSAPKIPMGFVSAPRDEVQGYLDARAVKHRNRQGGGEDESASIFRKMQAENRSFIQNPRFDLGVEVEDRLQSHVQNTLEQMRGNWHKDLKLGKLDKEAVSGLQVEDLLNEPAQRASKMAANFKQQALRYHPDIHFPGAATHAPFAPFSREDVFVSPPKPEGGGAWVSSHATATPLYPVHLHNAAPMQTSPSKAPYGSSSSHASLYGGHESGGYQGRRSPPKWHVGGGEGGGGYNALPRRGGYWAGGANNGDKLALDERRSWGDKQGGGSGQNFSPPRGGLGGVWAGGGRNEALPLKDLPMLR